MCNSNVTQTLLIWLTSKFRCTAEFSKKHIDTFSVSIPCAFNNTTTRGCP